MARQHWAIGAKHEASANKGSGNETATTGNDNEEIPWQSAPST
jgi:hypothetical protein